MNYIKLYENYFKDKKVLMNQIDNIHYKISDIQLSFKDQLIDDLADVSDIPSVKIYPLITLQDEIALNPEDGLETKYPDDEIYIEIHSKFEYVFKILKNLRSFENRYKNDYDILYTLDIRTKSSSTSNLLQGLLFFRKPKINNIINNFLKFFTNTIGGKINNDIISRYYHDREVIEDGESILIITLKEK